MSLMSMFAQRLRYLRKRSSLTQHELGHILNISTSSVGMYERGSREPSLNLLMDIAKYFDVSVDYLIGYDTSHLASSKEQKVFPKLSDKEVDVLLLKLEHPELFKHLLAASTEELEKIIKIIKIIRSE